jgi:hypothetical protein
MASVGEAEPSCSHSGGIDHVPGHTLPFRIKHFFDFFHGKYVFFSGKYEKYRNYFYFLQLL